MRISVTIKQLAGRYARHLPSAIGDIVQLTTDDMVERGIPRRTAQQIYSAVQLAREIAEPSADYQSPVTSPARAIDYCRAKLAHIIHEPQESFWVISLDSKLSPIAAHRVTKGTIRNSLVHPREVFRPAISDAANSILCAHNHPSGDPTPSEQDISVTDRLEKAGELIGIPLTDHIVIASRGCVSIGEWRSSR